MPFETVLSGSGEQAVVLLKDTAGNTFAEIFAFGCLLNKFSVQLADGELNIIDGFTDVQEAKGNIFKAFKSAKLSPFVCRVSKATYRFDENQYKLSKFFYKTSALHGLLFDAVFTVTAHYATDNCAGVKLEYVYDSKQEGFPFKYKCLVEYRLSAKNTLEVTTTITNLDEQRLPITDGWHPYFNLGDPINDYRLAFQSKEMLEFDENLIPTGKLLPYNDFNIIKNFGATQFDNCFTLNQEERQPLCVVRNPKRKVQLEIHPAASYPYLQIFTPDHRKSIAIENLSAAPDAFNNGIGLKVLEPQEEATFVVKYIVRPLE